MIKNIHTWVITALFSPSAAMQMLFPHSFSPLNGNIMHKAFRRIYSLFNKNKFWLNMLIIYYRFLLRLFVFDKSHLMIDSKKTIAFYPDLPSAGYSIFSICLFINARISDKIENADLVIKWKDETIYSLSEDAISHMRKKTNINIGCNDISKTYVDHVFSNIFGYSSIVDPYMYQNECVVKSNLNAKHDGKVIMCPIKTKDNNCIYQIKIDNRIGDSDLVLDIRVYVFGDSIPFVRYTYKPIEKQFGDIFVKVEFLKSEDVFTAKELEDIKVFCNAVGLGYGQLDILRNRTDNKMYIIDVNNTPSANSIPYFSFDRNMMAAKAFYGAFFKPTIAHESHCI